MLSHLINPLVVLISLTTTSGILVHDTHLDQAAAAISMPAFSATHDTSSRLGGEAHTHVERASVSQLVTSLNAHAPGMQPRSDRKHMLSKHVPRGQHVFDSYNLPVV